MADTRASDADREQTADRLRQAAAEGRLTVDELDDRLHAAYRTVTQAELARLVADLPAHPDARRTRMPVRPGEGGTERIVSILGGADRKGRWRIGARCRVTNVLGGADLDLTQAELGADRVEMRVFSLLGGSTINVPEHLNVEVSEMAFLGGNDVDLGESVPDPGGPVLHLHLVSILGGTDVRRGPRRSWWEKLAGPPPPRHLGGGHGHWHRRPRD